MTEYEQFCAIARAAEVIGERWTLLILRELHLGPRRFTDLKERLAPIAPGVLNGRLRALENRGVIARRTVPPPAPAQLYELTESGRALQPALFELLRWGARYLFPERPGERFEPEWLRMVLQAYASTRPTPSVEITVRVRDAAGESWPVATVVGGPTGTTVGLPAEGHAEITATPMALLGLMSGRMSLEEAESRGTASATGDRGIASHFAPLFEMVRQ